MFLPPRHVSRRSMHRPCPPENTPLTCDESRPFECFASPPLAYRLSRPLCCHRRESGTELSYIIWPLKPRVGLGLPLVHYLSSHSGPRSLRGKRAMAGCDCLTFWGFIPVTAVRADWLPFSFEVSCRRHLVVLPREITGVSLLTPWLAHSFKIVGDNR